MYYLVYIPLYLLSLLPFPVLYFFSDMAYGFLYYIMGYRKKVVMENLKIAFPEKTEAERTRIAKKFYHQFVDNFIETLKFLSLNEKGFAKRFDFDTSGLDQAYKSGKSIQLLVMHNFNWEYANWGMARVSKYPFLAIYMPVGNKHFDRIIMNMRARFGTILIPATNFRRTYMEYVKTQHTTGSVADQSPGDPRKAWWFYFFGKPTAFVTGPEKGARLNDSVLILINFYPTERRGYYKMTSTFLTDDPQSFPEKEITRQYVRYVEKCIREHPSNYLWSHRRWKHVYKEEYGEIT